MKRLSAGGAASPGVRSAASPMPHNSNRVRSPLPASPFARPEGSIGMVPVDGAPKNAAAQHTHARTQNHKPLFDGGKIALIILLAALLLGGLRYLNAKKSRGLVC